jgi:hypothetical protein
MRVNWWTRDFGVRYVDLYAKWSVCQMKKTDQYILTDTQISNSYYRLDIKIAFFKWIL